MKYVFYACLVLLLASISWKSNGGQVRFLSSCEFFLSLKIMLVHWVSRNFTSTVLTGK